jgi:hypothetical protein
MDIFPYMGRDVNFGQFVYALLTCRVESCCLIDKELVKLKLQEERDQGNVRSRCCSRISKVDTMSVIRSQCRVQL